MALGLVQVDGGARWLRVGEPARVIEARRPVDVVPALDETEADARRHGRFALGLIRYEAGRAFGLRVADDADPLPLVWFALFDRDQVDVVAAPRRDAAYRIGPPAATLDRPAFVRAFDRIHAHIADGDTYQVNFTFALRAPFEGDGESFFADLVASQGGRYGALLRVGSRLIASASPELFFARDRDRLVVRPMKGTARRGRSADEDAVQRRALASSSKDRAENVMIVDMMRSDVGRIAEVGSVETPDLWTVERYPTVWQMTSTVTGRTSASLGAIVAALFPSASVTGAPKVRTMEIIEALEGRARGVYTGAIGYVAPDGRLQFNVAIRTAVIDEARAALDFGVGSGIVWDSDADLEYDECLLKGAVLGRRPRPFALLETMRWTPDEGVFLLGRHLRRLEQSAGYFGFSVDLATVRSAIDQAVRGSGVPLRLRLLLEEDGAVRVERQAVEPWTRTWRVRLAASPIDPADVRLFHKTTDRRVYEERRRSDCDDVVLWNPAGEATESTIANLVVDVDGRRVTPPVGCGLLPGTLRDELLARGEVVESVVTVESLRRIRRFWLVNSVRGWWPAELAE